MDEDRKKALDDAYRADGWGKITDAALEIRPSAVESQARDVARWAHAEIERLQEAIDRVLWPAPGVRKVEPWVYGILGPVRRESERKGGDRG